MKFNPKLNNTLKNVFYLSFASMILTAYAYNFKDVADQNGAFIACCVMGLLLLPVAFLTAKLIKEL